MDAKERAKILHGLADIEARVAETLLSLRLDRGLTNNQERSCCIKLLEELQEDMKYGSTIIEDEVRWTSK